MREEDDLSNQSSTHHSISPDPSTAVEQGEKPPTNFKKKMLTRTVRVATVASRAVQTQQRRQLTTVSSPVSKAPTARQLFGLGRPAVESTRVATFHTASVARAEAGKIPVWTARKASIKTEKNSTFEFYEASQWALGIMTPIAFILSPSGLNFPVDVAMGLIIPYHMYNGCHHIFEDYLITTAYYGLAQKILLVVVALTVVGLLNLNFRGIGITEAIKSLWRSTPAAEESKDKSKGKH
eukprot:TRINITY_DN786_c0_g1_i1.p2 TRINITY_DN786_c0_g1~~TRINITY_DN786_c0_g1_i1.p2  ORF type:complete len:238 (-),score=66.39 TRINITY_DN786_c0_g1_i1:84-797(-)